MKYSLVIASAVCVFISSPVFAGQGNIFQVGFADVDNYTLPYYVVATGVPAVLGANVGRMPHRLLPMTANISKGEAGELAVYYFPDVGVLLAPRGWLPKGVSSIGTDGNGSAYLFGGDSWISFYRVPACAGCAYVSARTHLPWVKPEFYFGSPPPYKPFSGQKQVRISNRITGVRYISHLGGHVNGVIEYGTTNSVMDAYDSVWFYAPKMSHKLATAVLNFAIRYDIKKEAVHYQHLTANKVNNFIAANRSARQIAKSASFDASTSRTGNSPKFDVIGLTCHITSVGPEFEGEIKNTSTRSINDVAITSTFLNKKGVFISNGGEIPITFQPILPGQTSPFSQIGGLNPSVNNVRIKVAKFEGRELSFSGKTTANCK